jgi:hypothetical protein
MLIFSGFGEQLTPGGGVGQVTATCPMNPPLGVRVIVDTPAVPPAAEVVADPPAVKLPPCATVRGNGLDIADAA